MDAEIAKQAQKILGKQGIKFKLNTKVTGGDVSGEGVKLSIEAAKGGKEETVIIPPLCPSESVLYTNPWRNSSMPM